MGVALVLTTVAARPLATDDGWWHLAHGAAYAQHGPWLADDPLLFTAPGPPAPASWLADLALHQLLQSTGFAGLRALHAALVLTILALSYTILRRAGGSCEAAAAATLAFAMLAAYRLIQLRPELFSLAATLLLVRHVLEPGLRPSWWRIAFVFVLCALWSNLHAGFVLGPLLIAVATVGLLAALPLRSADARRTDLARAGGLALAWAAAVLGSLVNPAGVYAWRPLWAAGDATPSLLRVADEWTALGLLTWPDAGAQGGAFAWALVWGLIVATFAIGMLCVRGWIGGRSRMAREIEPTQLGLAVAALVGMLMAVRLLWLGLLPLLLLVRASRVSGLPEHGARRAVLLVVCVTLVFGFFRQGDGRRVLAELPRTPSEYAAPFHAARYFAHSAWLLRDAQLSGRLFADYFLGGFHGYWLAPRVQSFANGSLNVTPEAMSAHLPLRARRGERPGESFLALLDRHAIDLYLGTRLPEEGPAGRPWFFTTFHLEGMPGWIPVFRNLRSALYLRDLPRNAEALRRIDAWYESRSVPFDPAQGFDVAQVIREAPGFAVSRGIVPRQLDALVASLHGAGSLPPPRAADRLASIYALTGLYDEAIRLDRRQLRGGSATSLVVRRLVWSLLRAGLADEAFEVVRSVRPAPSPPSLWVPLASAAQALRSAPARQSVDASATLPFLTRREARRALQGFVHPRARVPRVWREDGSS